MSRALRPRKARPSYASQLGISDGAGPSTIPLEDEGSSGSDFAPEPEVEEEAHDDLLEMDVDEERETDHASTARTPPPKVQRAPGSSLSTTTAVPFATSKSRKDQSRRLPPKSHAASKMSAPPLASGRTGKSYALPNPSIHHRHRAVPFYFREAKVERLEAPPVICSPVQTVPTNSITSEQALTDRVSKAWGYNVGAGPIWEIMEDRSCFKEALCAEGEEEKEKYRRPRVYGDVVVKRGWEILRDEDAAKYLPTDTVTTEDGRLKPPPPIQCHLGPFNKQTRVEMNMFDSLAISEFIPGAQSYVFNAGSPVWGLDWCPIHPDDRPHRKYKQYLAVAPFPSRSHAPNIGSKTQRPTPACVQIWALQTVRRAKSADGAEMTCEMVLCLDGGPAHEVKWCPLPAHDERRQSKSGPEPRKLGLLAGTFEDGSLSIYAVPDPVDVTPRSQESSLPVYVRLPEPLLRIELEETSCWTLDWANSEVIAVGCTNGYIAVYDIGKALKTGEGPNILPTHFIAVHQSALRALAWIRVPPTSAPGAPVSTENPTIIASGGYDGVECLTDIREPHGNVMNRTRDVINSATYSPFAAGPIMIDHDNTVKAYTVSPSMLGRGHVLLEPDGPVWSVNASEYHPQLAVGSADGSCVTTNTHKSTRRGGAVPFFVHKIYQLDYSRKTGEFRMLERFLPQETQEKSTNTKGKKKDDDNSASNSTGVWPPEVGVHRVVWNSANGLGSAPLLASATGSGLCRVDWLLGRFIRDKVPYVDVPSMRKEVDGVADDDSGED
ncbi:hypothetical protein BV22DRAFT_1195685 [Leucogyrophana mollusca]|uniref:Uncharacterized protein n=1 Tax=Leucogyrophana mollusca TaxID=85980 RepID=A0ACB8BIU3_9AGAM|nr:hypothetical protein BV22DRAFT_1195685 [Leucogyrophana mollusca]